MKKLLYLTFLTLSLTCLVACGDDDDNDDGGGTNTSKFDDWNDPKSPNYKPEGYNPIAGEWHHKSSTVTKYLFTEDFKIKVTSINDDGEWKSGWGLLSTYKINDKKIKTSSGLDVFGGGGTVFEYQLYEEDGKETLLIYNYYKYYRVTQ